MMRYLLTFTSRFLALCVRLCACRTWPRCGPCCGPQELVKAGVAPRNILFLNVVSCPEGLAVLTGAYPEVTVVTAAVDPRLNEHKYLVPGLGDYGDRYFGTVTH